MTLPARMDPYHIRGLTLRQLTGQNKAQFLSVQQTVLDGLPCQRWYYPAEEWEFDEWIDRRDAVGYFDGEDLVAFAVLTPWHTRSGHSYAQVLGEPKENTFDFHDVMVLPAYRGRGIHSSFLRLFTEMARAMDGRAIYATVDPDNGASWRNFEKAGYVCVRTEDAYDGRPRRYYKLTLL